MISEFPSTNSRQRPVPLFACPTPPESLAFPTYWYRLPTNDHFLICTKCYEEKLHSTPFASLLRCDRLDFGTGMIVTCDFNTPRIDSLLRLAVASNDFQQLFAFAERRLTLEICPGVKGIKGGSNVKWFRPVNDAIPSFVCCEACYEDVVSGTNFRAYFIPCREQQPMDLMWSCDLAVPYMKHSLPKFASGGEWQHFVQGARHRMSLPECVSGRDSLIMERKWYNTVKPSPIHDMTVCEACYLDRAGWQQGIAHNFTQIPFNVHHFSTRLICDLRPAPLVACADILLANGMYEKWHHFAGLVMSKPSCSSEGILDGEWYGLPDSNNPSQIVENFDICAACHAGWNQSADWGHIFRTRNFPTKTTRFCDFNPSSWRFRQYVEKWNQMYFTHDPTPFIDYVSRFASLGKCQGVRRLQNANWYGDKNASFLICPCCFEEAVRGTYFAPAFPLQKTLLPGGHHCSLYSARMREKYAEACKQRSLDALLSFAARREDVYQQTIPQIEAFQASQQQKVELLNLAEQQRTQALGHTLLTNVFTGSYPIVSNYDLAVINQTLLVDQQRSLLVSDPRRPAVMELEARWREVE